MLKLYDKVIITSKNIIGTIVDVSKTNGKITYIIESDTKGKGPTAYGGIWSLYDCSENEIKPFE
ncbi:MAG: hypothetical protein LUG26_09655 [Ruminococcus sp.]|nr:hypothetical protein [Ruminococcus sp.]